MMIPRGRCGRPPATPHGLAPGASAWIKADARRHQAPQTASIFVFSVWALKGLTM
jgi:hypothetical protein